MNSKQNYPSTMYATPDVWGNVTIYGDATAMAATIKSLKDAGGSDWDSIELSDCTQYELVGQCSNGDAAYRPRHVRHDHNRDVLILRPDGEGWFNYVETFDAKYDTDELAALGVSI